MKKNPFPFNWMSEKATYLFRDSCVEILIFPGRLKQQNGGLKNI